MNKVNEKYMSKINGYYIYWGTIGDTLYFTCSNCKAEYCVRSLLPNLPSFRYCYKCRAEMCDYIDNDNSKIDV